MSGQAKNAENHFAKSFGESKATERLPSLVLQNVSKDLAPGDIKKFFNSNGYHLYDVKLDKELSNTSKQKGYLIFKDKSEKLRVLREQNLAKLGSTNIVLREPENAANFNSNVVVQNLPMDMDL